jgi:hypothetical protein
MMRGETYTGAVEVLVSEPAKVFVATRGGKVYVRAHRHQCCSGALTMLDIATKAPKDRGNYVDAHADGVDVRYDGGFSGQPHQLVIELRGILRPHLVAYWDGCAYKM